MTEPTLTDRQAEALCALWDGGPKDVPVGVLRDVHGFSMNIYVALMGKGLVAKFGTASGPYYTLTDAGINYLHRHEQMDLR